jgi:hypothetical protein
LPSHKVSLTNRGFKILSTDLHIDFASLGIVSILLFLGWSSKLDTDLLYAEAFFFSTLLYVFYRYKFGYLYFVSFFYQIILFLLLTPIGYLNPYTILVSFLFTFPFFIGRNSFQAIYFPMGLYMSLIAYCAGVLGEKLSFWKIQKLSLVGLENYLPGFFFKPFLVEKAFYSESLLSPLELSGFSALLGLGILILREFSFFMDFSCSSLMVAILLFLFQFDLALFQPILIPLFIAWFLLFAGPGRNFGFSYIFSIISLVFTGLVCYLLWKKEWVVPPIAIISVYFVIQTFFYMIVMGKLLRNIPFLKSVLRK